MATDEKYILSLTKEQALAVSKACEFYSRVMMGQFGEIAYETMLQSIKQDDFCTRREMMEDLLFQARQFAFPDLMGRGHSYGIGHNKSADLAWNAYQALRYAKAWHEHPEGGITVDFNKPYPAGGEAVPDCKAEAMSDMTLEAISYEQARLEYFREQKRKCEQKLHWWKHQKPYKQYDLIAIQGKCFDFGQKIAFYEDAIERFGGVGRGTQAVATCDT